MSEAGSDPRRLRITGLHHITLLCADVSRSASFYRDLLGMQLVERSHNPDDPNAGTPVKTGLKYVAFTTRGIDVNMQPRRIDAEFTDLMTSDGVPIDFHAVISLQVIDSVKLVRDFGADAGPDGIPGFWNRNLDQPFRTAVRDAVKAHGMNEMAIQATAADEVDNVVTEHLLRIVKETNVPVKKNSCST